MAKQKAAVLGVRKWSHRNAPSRGGSHVFVLPDNPAWDFVSGVDDDVVLPSAQRHVALLRVEAFQRVQSEAGRAKNRTGGLGKGRDGGVMGGQAGPGP